MCPSGEHSGGDNGAPLNSNEDEAVLSDIGAEIDKDEYRDTSNVIESNTPAMNAFRATYKGLIEATTTEYMSTELEDTSTNIKGSFAENHYGK